MLPMATIGYGSAQESRKPQHFSSRSTSNRVCGSPRPIVCIGTFEDYPCRHLRCDRQSCNATDISACFDCSTGVPLVRAKLLASVLIDHAVVEFSAADWADSRERKQISRWTAEAKRLRDGGYTGLIAGR